MGEYNKKGMSWEIAITWKQSRQLWQNRSYSMPPQIDRLGDNGHMTTINTIEDLARLLREKPTWADALRSLILSQDLLDLPNRLDKFIEEQQQVNAEQRQFNAEQRQVNAEQRQFNEDQRQFNEEVVRRLNSVEGRLGNLEGGEYERRSRSRALARSILVLDFESPYIAFTQEGVIDPRFTASVERAVRSGRISREQMGDLYEADLVISANDNRHAVIEVSITADNDDIRRAKDRSEILANITEGDVRAVVITANLGRPQRRQAEEGNVAVFMAS